ncbi:hypothetical protein [Actinocrispum sp. NPDC049592]|uniref:hypothetical protein n=1 Tax=Actinocrispum sp. NPDC049592 TaxID=3154835 RepID=UPI0034259E51
MARSKTGPDPVSRAHVLDALLDRALADREVMSQLDTIDSGGREEVRQALSATEAAIFSAARDQEDRYRALTARAARDWGKIVAWALMGLVYLIPAALTLLALYMFARSLAAPWPVVTLIVGGGAVIAAAGVLVELRVAGQSEPEITAFTLVLLATGALAYFLGYEAWSILIAVGSVVVFGFVAIGLANLSDVVEELFGVDTASPSDVESAFAEWRSALYTLGVVPALISYVNVRTEEQYSITPRYRAEFLSRAVDPAELHQRTPAGARLAEYFRTLRSGSFAISGPRGAGKSALMAAFSRGMYNESPRQDLVVAVLAPVEYVARDFMLHLHIELCESVLRYVGADAGKDNGLRRFALQRRAELRYLQTVQGERSGKIGFSGSEIALRKSVSRVEQARTFPEIVARLRADLVDVAQRIKDGPGEPRVIICVDELDRIQNEARAVGFLNEIKAIFRVPNCYCLVSVSEDAMHDFELAGLGMRTVMDSAFDEVLWVDYLDFELSKRLLGNYIVGLSEQYLAFAYVRSGGLARQLLRAARELLDWAGKDQADTLCTVVGSLVANDLRRVTEAVKGSLVKVSDRAVVASLVRALDAAPGQVSEPGLFDYAAKLSSCTVGDDITARDLRDTMTAQALYLATVTGVFRDDLDRQRMTTAGKPGATFDALARIRRYVGMNPQAALALLDDFRPEWGLAALGR